MFKSVRQNCKVTPFQISSIYVLFIGLIGCLPIPTQTNTSENTPSTEKPFTTAERVYEANIKTIQLYPASTSGDTKQYFEAPIVPLGFSQNLRLEFDQLSRSPENYTAKIIHCNATWEVSNLMDIEYMNEVNNFPLRDYQLSFNTKVSYLHYTFTLPKLKVSGNYILLIYRNGDENDRIFTRRFVLYESKVAISPEVRFSSNPALKDKNQQIDFKISYADYEIRNPRDEISIVIRQNNRWNRIISDLKPVYIRDLDKVLEYNHFNAENNFAGLNEYRRFDIKSTRFLGFRVAGISKNDTSYTAELALDQSRTNDTYFAQQDYNGNYIIGHYETGRGTLESDYIKVRFRLKSLPIENAVVSVVGDFSSWAAGENLMQYTADKQLYTADIWLKQGEYNYMYAVAEGQVLNESIFEGSHQAAENRYDILVYHRPIGARADKVIGYKNFSSIAPR